jgi:hypothetical protein
VLKVEEFKHVYQSLKRKWLKIRTIPEIANQETI